MHTQKQLKELLDDYYKLKVRTKDLAKRIRISQSLLYKKLDELGYKPPRVYYGMLDLGDEELNTRMKDKYASIVKRCNGADSIPFSFLYDGKDYMPIYDWVNFCLKHKALLVDMWEKYIESGREFRLNISIDRIDNSKGYIEDNIRFTTQGFNAWKRNIRPIRVTHNKKDNYFMSCEEAARHYGIRRQSIGDILRGVNREIAGKYQVEHSNAKEVLKKNNVNSLDKYYTRVLKT